jgi:uncharacterized Zn finger protein
MTSDAVTIKAAHYLVGGRIRVLLVHRGRVFAEARGSERYELGFTDARGFWCSCPARRECAHLVALRLIVGDDPSLSGSELDGQVAAAAHRGRR